MLKWPLNEALRSVTGIPIFSFLTVPSEVVGVTLMKRSSVTLSLAWQRPLRSVGHIIAYEVQVNVDNDDSLLDSANIPFSIQVYKACISCL